MVLRSLKRLIFIMNHQKYIQPKKRMVNSSSTYTLSPRQVLLDSQPSETHGSFHNLLTVIGTIKFRVSYTVQTFCMGSPWGILFLQL